MTVKNWDMFNQLSSREARLSPSRRATFFALLPPLVAIKRYRPGRESAAEEREQNREDNRQRRHVGLPSQERTRSSGNGVADGRNQNSSGQAPAAATGAEQEGYAGKGEARGDEAQNDNQRFTHKAPFFSKTARQTRRQCTHRATISPYILTYLS